MRKEERHFAGPCSGQNDCGVCIANKKGRTSLPGHRHFRAARVRQTPQWGAPDMKKPVGSNGTVDLPTCRCPFLQEAGEAVVEHLRDSSWEDGSTRERSTLTVFVEDGKVKVCLNDRNSNSSLFRAADTLLEALQSLNEALAPTGHADWRAWNFKKRK